MNLVSADTRFFIKMTVMPLIFIALTIAATDAFAQNLLIKDYKVPVTSASSFLIDFNYNYATAGTNETANQGKIGTVYKTFYESLNYGRSFDLVWSASRRKNSNNFSTDLDWRIKKFVQPNRKFFGSTNFNGGFFKGDERPAFDVTVGAGLGRFINATSLAKAVRIEDFLLFSGQLYDDLPADTMINLAQIIERQKEYRDRHGENFKRFWYNDMTEAIEASNMLKAEEVDAARILRMDEVLFRERISDRFYGWDATLGTKFELSTPKSSIGRVNPAVDLTIRYSRPISWRAQFNERVSVNSPMGNDFLRGYSVISASDFSYEVTNRIDFGVNYLIRSEKRLPGTDALTSHALSVLFSFFLENQINLTTRMQLTKSSETALNQSYVMTLNYRVF